MRPSKQQQAFDRKADRDFFKRIFEKHPGLKQTMQAAEKRALQDVARQQQTQAYRKN